MLEKLKLLYCLSNSKNKELSQNTLSSIMTDIDSDERMHRVLGFLGKYAGTVADQERTIADLMYQNRLLTQNLLKYEETLLNEEKRKLWEKNRRLTRENEKWNESPMCGYCEALHPILPNPDSYPFPESNDESEDESENESEDDDMGLTATSVEEKTEKNAKLKKEIARLKKENERLMEENAKLKDPAVCQYCIELSAHYSSPEDYNTEPVFGE